MSKLKDLTPQALADLLDLPLDKARMWLEDAKPTWMDHWFRNYESATSLHRRTLKELMDLSFEEAQQMKTTGELYQRFPYLKPKIPKDTETRLRYLRELLGRQPEFAARYPTAYELLFGGSSSGTELRLPSFDVRILPNAPQEVFLPAYWFQESKMFQESGDAWSSMGEVDLWELILGLPSFAPLNLQYMQGVLLAVLSREEYAERVATNIYDDAIREEIGAPTQSYVRITDLRLATSSKLEDSHRLKEALEPLLGSLEKPVTRNGVLQWKWDLLWEDEEEGGRRSEEQKSKTVRVSFAAAALLLFLDFDMPGIKNASSQRLATHVIELAAIIRKVSSSLKANARKLNKLLAYRHPNRPYAPGGQFYKALVYYRMGEDKDIIAKRLGLTPYKSSPSKPGGSDFGGTKDWRSRLEEKLRRGAEIEKAKHPYAASVLENRHKPRIERKARLAYQVYLEVTELGFAIEDKPPWSRIGEELHIRISHDPGFEVALAYVQLGSCLDRNLNPFPTRSDFDA